MGKNKNFLPGIRADRDKEELKKRLFIAIDIPGDIKDNIYKFINGLLGEDKHIKIVAAPNIHITLKFLGDTNINKIMKIKEVLRNTASEFKKFRYEISRRINAFPDTGNARVIFLETGRGSDKISKIYKRLEDNLGRIKIKREKRKFFPHITVARAKIKKDIRDLTANNKKNINENADCLRITLFESKLKPWGAEYIILDNFSLK